jgi:hypothetical protein
MLNAAAFSSPNEGTQLQAFFRDEADCDNTLGRGNREKGAKRS